MNPSMALFADCYPKSLVSQQWSNPSSCMMHFIQLIACWMSILVPVAQLRYRRNNRAVTTSGNRFRHKLARLLPIQPQFSRMLRGGGAGAAERCPLRRLRGYRRPFFIWQYMSPLKIFCARQLCPERGPARSAAADHREPPFILAAINRIYFSSQYSLATSICQHRVSDPGSQSGSRSSGDSRHIQLWQPHIPLKLCSSKSTK